MFFKKNRDEAAAETAQVSQEPQFPSSSEASEVVRVAGLKKTYINGDIEVEALKGIDLTIKKGEFIAIMGASGSGKSTFMNILGCLDRPSAGSFLLDGEDVSQCTDDELSYVRNQKIGFVFQSFNLIPRTSALKNVELPMVYGRVPAEKRRERALELLEKVGLSKRYEHMPNELSGGQRQRVAIARALANDPPIIFADEPTGNLDSHTTEEVLQLLQRIVAKEGKTLIMVTHDPQIAAWADRQIRVVDGKVVETVIREDSAVEQRIQAAHGQPPFCIVEKPD